MDLNNRKITNHPPSPYMNNFKLCSNKLFSLIISTKETEPNQSFDYIAGGREITVGL